MRCNYQILPSSGALNYTIFTLSRENNGAFGLPDEHKFKFVKIFTQIYVAATAAAGEFPRTSDTTQNLKNEHSVCRSMEKWFFAIA